MDMSHTRPVMPVATGTIDQSVDLPFALRDSRVDILQDAMASLTPQQVETIDAAAVAIRGVLYQGSVDIGRQLAIAKEILPHGAFTTWVETALGIKSRTARRYLAVAEFLEGKPAKLADLPQTLIERLASPKLPSEVVEGVLAAVEDGERASDVERRLNQADEDALEIKYIKLRSRKRNLTDAEAKAKLQEQRREAKADQKQREQAAADRVAADLQARSDRNHARQKAHVVAKPLAEQVAAAIGAGASELHGLLSDPESRDVFLEALLCALRTMAVTP